ncbi:MAG: phosphoribosylglycinamide formyltransferase [Ktedonobacterales bacterium]|nr:phosphoribosylglycinamide formyltransferase [Ktedonobacterales bacterium]
MSAADEAALPAREDAPVIGVLVSGQGSNLEAIFAAIARGELRARVGLVISSRPDAPALERAIRRGVATRVIVPKAYATRAEAGVALVAALRAAGCELVVLAGYKPILDAGVVRAFQWRILNVHPSLLPAFAGGMAPRPQAEALAAGVKISGCTVHFVTEAVDAGPILAQAAVPVRDDDTVDALAKRILAQEHRLLPWAIARVLAGHVRVDGRRVVGVDVETSGEQPESTVASHSGQ